MNIFYPRIHLRQLPAMLEYAALGALLAGVYGIIHDQITYSISPEYFTRLKFLQFHYADFGLPHRWFVAEIGFLATWWVGLIVGWFISRKTVPHLAPNVAFTRSLQGFAIVFGAALAAATIGYLLGLLRGPSADLSRWRYFASEYKIQDLPNFVRVAYIHNASYIGGLVGLVAATFFLQKRLHEPSKTP